MMRSAPAKVRDRPRRASGCDGRPAGSGSSAGHWPPHRGRQQLVARLVYLAVFAHLGGADVRVAGQQGRGCQRSSPADPALAHAVRARKPRVSSARAASTRARIVADNSPRRSSDSFSKRAARDFNVDVDPVEQRSGQALLVLAHQPRAADSRPTLRIAEITTRTWILGFNEHETSREGQAALSAADGDDFVLQRLT